VTFSFDTTSGCGDFVSFASNFPSFFLF